uniref:Uncharacterized protein n=1 Tax=Eutreptiella gymnastica TaxID=73025 RepID=A0A7S1IU46_9EUGL
MAHGRAGARATALAPLILPLPPPVPQSTPTSAPAPTLGGCPAFVAPTRRAGLALWAMGSDSGGGEQLQDEAVLSPQSEVGHALERVRRSAPADFMGAWEAAVQRLCDEQRQARTEVPEGADAATVDFLNRLNGNRVQAIRDLLLCHVQHEFEALGVLRLRPADLQGARREATTVAALTTGLYSAEALDLVKAHMGAVLAPIAASRISAFQAALMFANSIRFGYFLRRADRRYQFERTTGFLPTVQVEQAGDLAQQVQTLSEYIADFDPATMEDMSRITSTEALALASEYTQALVGDIEKLRKEVTFVVNFPQPTPNPGTFGGRLRDAVRLNQISVVELGFQQQQALVLEGVAFGAFLRDAESRIAADSEEALLTSAPAQGPVHRRPVGAGRQVITRELESPKDMSDGCGGMLAVHAAKVWKCPLPSHPVLVFHNRFR